jgi:hypothetical protein
MSDPLSDRCLYCGAHGVLDDAWFCGSLKCLVEYESEDQQSFNDKLRACGLTELISNPETAA